MIKRFDQVIDKLSNKEMIVTDEMNENMFKCRFVKSDGDFDWAWFYKDEIRPNKGNNKIGFDNK